MLFRKNWRHCFPLLLALWLNLGDGFSQGGEQSIVILFENDVHCAIEGYTRLAGLRDAIADTAWVAVVSSGDFLQGGPVGVLSQGEHVIGIMNSVGYDAVTLGNHEFDYKVPRLLEILPSLHAPVVCCNLREKATGQHLFAPYVLRSYGKRKVAFIGALTPDAMNMERYAFYDEAGKPLYDTQDTSLYRMVQRTVDAVRSEGADFVLLLSHLGEYDGGCEYSSDRLIAATTGIDALLDGHTHSVKDTVLPNLAGQPVMVAQTGTRFSRIGKLRIGPEGGISIDLLPVTEVPYRSARVDRTVDSVKSLLAAQTDMLVFQSEVELAVWDEKASEWLVRTGETNAGDLVADAIRYVGDAQIGLINAGGIRTNLPAGAIRYGEVVSMLPFEDMVWTIEATGAEIVEAIRQNATLLPEADGSFPQVSGLRYGICLSDHSVWNVEVLQPDGTYAPLDPQAAYRVAVLDYVVTGGGLRNCFAGCNVLHATPLLYRDALIKFVNEQLGGIIGNTYAFPQGRITIGVK